MRMRRRIVTRFAMVVAILVVLFLAWAPATSVTAQECEQPWCWTCYDYNCVFALWNAHCECEAGTNPRYCIAVGMCTLVN